MKRIIIFMLAVFLLPLGSKAQLSKLMAKYHEQPSVTVTQLDKSLYGLYKKQNLSPEAEEMLHKLDEVNILNINLATCEKDAGSKISKQLREILDSPDKYRLIKSHTDESGKQLIYAKNQNNKVTSLVVWNQNQGGLDVIELRGDIQLENVALLSKALNVKGLNTLSALTPQNDNYTNFKRQNNLSFDDFNDDLVHMSKEMQKMAEGMRKNMGNFGEFGDLMNDMFGSLGESFDKMGSTFQQYDDAMNSISNSVQISNENGKTKIKIDSKNSEMNYVIDGKDYGKDSVKMPDQIRNVNIRPSKESFKKSYLFIESENKIGQFINCKDGILSFKFENQDYKYNLKKSNTPLLVIDGELSDNFDIDPSEILQIRPQSKIEKELGNYPSAEIIINTK